MDLKDQLQSLFPDHKPQEEPNQESSKPEVWLQDDPLICKYEKRKGKPITIIEGYNGAQDDFRKLSKILKTKLSVGGSHKEDRIIIQGDLRDKIMEILQSMGFKTKRVGG